MYKLHIYPRCDGCESYSLWTSKRQEFTAWKAQLIIYTTVLPIWVCKSYSVICGHFSTGGADFDNSGSRSCSLSMKQVQPFRRWEGAWGPLLIPSLASPGSHHHCCQQLHIYDTLMFVRRAHCVVHMRPRSPWEPRSGGRSWSLGTKPWWAAKYPKAVCWRLSMGKNNFNSC